MVAIDIRWCTSGEHIPADIADEAEWCCTSETIVNAILILEEETK